MQTYICIYICVFLDKHSMTRLKCFTFNLRLILFNAVPYYVFIMWVLGESGLIFGMCLGLFASYQLPWSGFCASRRGQYKMAAILQTIYFLGHFLEWKLFNFNYNFTELCSLGSNWQYGIIGSDSGLAPNRCQAIMWTNEALGYWCIYMRHSPSMS